MVIFMDLAIEYYRRSNQSGTTITLRACTYLIFLKFFKIIFQGKRNRNSYNFRLSIFFFEKCNVDFHY